MELAADTPVGFVPFTARAVFDESGTGVSHPHRIVYAIHSVDDVAAGEMLRMDPNTGNLVLEKSMSKRIHHNFTVVVSAKVGGKENFASVVFTPKLANEHAPVFVFDHYEFYLDSKGEAGSQAVGRVEAYDPDPRDYGRVAYSIVSGEWLYKIETNRIRPDERRGDSTKQEKSVPEIIPSHDSNQKDPTITPQ